MAKPEEIAEIDITTQPRFLRLECRYTDEKNAIAKASDTKPCRESDETIPVTDTIMHMMADILNMGENVLTNKIVNAKTEKTAMSADAKFGFPTVAITAL
jgi:hypothetical protein